MSLDSLLEIPAEQRDPDWERRFFDAIVNSKLEILDPNPQQGPDGWPYLLAETSEEATEPTPKVMNWLASRGIGLVVNPSGEYPDYVFNYGMVWHFRETGLFMQIASETKPATLELSPGANIHAGPPTEDYLPEDVRKVLREFFRDQTLLSVRILVMSEDRKHYDLAFSLESLGNPPEKEHQGIAEAISWFLPPHYSLVLVSEQGLPEFVAL